MHIKARPGQVKLTVLGLAKKIHTVHIQIIAKRTVKILNNESNWKQTLSTFQSDIKMRFDSYIQ